MTRKTDSLSSNYKSFDDLNTALSLYRDTVLLWGEMFNLTAASSADEFDIFHIKDSLLPFEIIESYVKEKCKTLSEGESIPFADLGTGAGLPLIPLALAFSNYDYPLEFYGIDRSLKRCTFLKNTINVLKQNGFIKNDIKIINNDISSIKEQFDFITFRAFTDIKEVEKPIRHILKDGGIVFAYKGKKQTAEKELGLLAKFSGEVIELEPLEGRERSLMILRPR